MQRVNLNGVDLEYAVQGSGELLLLIHGSILADAFSPPLTEPSIASNYRVISYHRRGFAGSSRARWYGGRRGDCVEDEARFIRTGIRPGTFRGGQRL